VIIGEGLLSLKLDVVTTTSREEPHPESVDHQGGEFQRAGLGSFT